MWADYSVAWIVCHVVFSGSWSHRRCRGHLGPLFANAQNAVLSTDINGWSWTVNHTVVLQKVFVMLGVLAFGMKYHRGPCGPIIWKHCKQFSPCIFDQSQWSLCHSYVWLSMCLSKNVVQKLLLAACLVKTIQCAKVHLISSLWQNMVTSMI